MAYVPPTSEPIAIIGRSCRYPGSATTPSKLWDLLQNPHDISQKIPPTRFNVDGFYDEDGERHGTTNAPKAFFLDEDVRGWDTSFFNTTPKEAEAIDPQAKLLLEVVYEGMESAGLTLRNCASKKIGVFVGLMTADFELLTAKDELSFSQYCATGTHRALISNRVSYFFNWNGPSMTIDTACSASLVALHQAVLSLRSGEISLACVAGVNLLLGPDLFTAQATVHMLSPNGTCKMWDESADGYARGDGVGVFFLKPLSQALADGDRVECIIRETGVNSDGRTTGITMPSPEAQSALIQDTYRRSGLDIRNPAHRCQYFEAHGTGTQAGDPREARAIHDAFFGDPEPNSDSIEPSQEPGQDSQQLIVGSIKTVIGHTEGAAGVAGLLKAALAMEHGVIPPNQHFHNVNPSVAPFTRHLKVPTSLTAWPHVPLGQPLRVSVNSFGFGGTNAHAILEKYDPQIHGSCSLSLAKLSKNPASGVSDTSNPSSGLPILLSANSEKTLVKMIEDYSSYLLANPGTNMCELATTLALHRSAHPHKFAFPASSRAEETARQMDSKLEIHKTNPDSEFGVRSRQGDGPGRILGIFTGQGAQWPTMGKGLMKAFPSFKESLTSLDDILKSCPNPPTWSIIQELLAPAEQSRLDEAAISQPLCTAIQIALVDLLARVGVKLSAVVGHSSGEIGAAYASGVLEARDAILIAYYRGVHAKLAGSSNGERGGMMAVGMGIDEALDFCSQDELHSKVFIAASNASASVTLSGDLTGIKAGKAMLDREKKFCRLLRVDTAYHSHHMEPCSAPYLESLEASHITAKLPSNSRPWVSSVYGPAGSPTAKELAGRYWRDNMVQPVLFSQALSRVLTENDHFDAVLEIGPHPALKGPATQTMQEVGEGNVPYMGVLGRGKDDISVFSEALGALWCHLGAAAIDLAGYSTELGYSSSGHKMANDLPPYHWDHSQLHSRQPRLMKQYLHRAAPPNELLGNRTSDDTISEYRWRNILKPTTIPWLQHHRFQGQVLVPVAAYCVMALDAAKAWVRGTGKRAAKVEIQDLDIRNGIPMDIDDSQGVETVFAMRLDPGQSTEDGHTITANFSLDFSPMTDSGTMRHAVSGGLAIELARMHDAKKPTILPPRSSSNQSSLNKVNVDEFYSSMKEIGLDYTGPFRALDSVQRRINFASGHLDSSSTGNADMGSRLSLHPALLDACFQAVFVAFAAPYDGALWTSFLPRSISRLRFNTDLCDSGPEKTSLVEVEATVTRFDPTSPQSQASFSGDVEIFDSHGCMQVQLEGVTLQSFAASTKEDDREFYLQTLWKRDPWTGFDVQDQEAGELKADQGFVDLCRRVERLYLPAPSNNGRDDHQFNPTYCKTTHDNGSLEALIGSSPHRHHLELLKACGERMPALVPSLAQEMIQESIDVSRFLRHLTLVVEHISHRHPHINVLEINLGNDAILLTDSVLAGLAEVYASYTYASSNTSPHSVNSRRHQISSVLLRDGSDGLVDFVENTNQSFDLVVVLGLSNASSEVLEARQTSIRQLMKPGGFFLAVSSRGHLLRDNMLSLLSAPSNRDSWRDGGENQVESRDIEASTVVTSGSWEPLHQFNLARAGMSLSVLQANSPEVALLRSPLSNVPLVASRISAGTILIIGGKRPEVNKLRRRLEEVLTKCAVECKLLFAMTFGDIPDHLDLKAVIILEDLDEPIFKDITAHTFSKLQFIFSPKCYILWLTNGFYHGNPYHAASVGFGRTVKTETPHLQLQFLDIDTLVGVHDVVAETFLRLALMCEEDMGAGSTEDSQSLLWTTEPEILFTKGQMLLPRVSPIQDMNNRLNSTRRVIGKEVDIANTAAELALIQERGEPVYDLISCKKSSQTHDEDPGGTIDVSVMYVSAWAIGFGKASSFQFVGLGKTSGGSKVLFVSPTNSSWVRVPRSWTLLLGSVNLDDERTAVLIIRAFVIQRVLALSAITTSTDVNEVVILGSDSPFMSAMEQQQSLSNSENIQIQNLQVYYPTTEQAAASDDGRFVYIHSHASERSIRASLPPKLGILVNLAEDETGVPSLFPRLAHTLSPAHCIPVTSIAQRSSHMENNSDDLDSVVADALQKSQELVTTANVSLIDANAYNATSDPVNDLSGTHGSRSCLATVDWTKDAQITERVRDIDPTSVLSPSRTYVLIGLTGDLGESLCWFMASHGARHFVVASRNPTKAHAWSSAIQRATGATIHLVPLDVVDISEVRSLKQRLQHSCPPIGGVVNGAMLLEDSLFADMSHENFQKVFKPKAIGSQNLSDVFCEPELEFFIMFSSLTCLCGNAGQSNYTAANLFMAGLAAQRRSQGLAASSLDIGIVYGIGYVNRVDGSDIYKNLRRLGYLPISERDIHHMFVESIVAGHPKSSIPWQLSTGLQRWNPSADLALPWQMDPRFSHHMTGAAEVGSRSQVSSGSETTQSIKETLRASQTQELIVENLLKAFVHQLESMLHLPPNSVNKDVPIVDLGVDSLAAVEVRSWFLKDVEKDMPVLKILGGASPATLCAEIATQIFDDRLALESEAEASEADDESAGSSYDDFSLNHNYTDMSSEDGEEGAVTYDQISPMSYSQARMWFPYLLLEDKTTYNCTTSYRLRGPLDVDRYEAALQTIIQKNQVFRTCFYTDHFTGEAMQAVATYSPFQLKKVSNANDHSDVVNETSRISGHTYDIESGDVFMSTVLSHGRDYHTIIFGYHHIILDGVSWQHFLQAVERYYEKSPQSQQQAWQSSDYIDFAIKQRAEMHSSANMLTKRAFWKKQFGSGRLPSTIPLFPFAQVASRKSALQRYEASEYFVELDALLVKNIKTAATGNKSTTFHFHLTILQIMLYRLLGVDNVCIGITDANRSDPAFMETIGLMLDSLPLWFKFDDNNNGEGESFAERLHMTRNTVYEALGNSGVPLDVILADSGVETTVDNLPLFQVLLNFRMGGIRQKSMGSDVALEFLSYKDARHPFDFILTVDEDEGRAGLTLSVQDYLYNSTAADVFLKTYIHLLEAFSRKPALKLKEPDAFPSSQVLAGVRLGKGNELDSSSWPTTLPTRVDDMVSRFPNHVALKDGTSTVAYTYCEMAARVNSIALALVKQRASRGTRVGVLSGPSVDAVLSLLAILQISAVYVPLDDRSSDERLSDIISQSSTTIIIHTSAAKARVVAIIPPDSQVASIDISTVKFATTQDSETIENKSSSQDLALIMFTSGSTGKPKGIKIKHSNFNTHVQAASATMDLRLGQEVVLQQSALGYDASLAQIFYALANGGTLVVSSNRNDVGDIVATMAREKVTLTLMAPSEYAVLFRYDDDGLLGRCSGWRVAMCGGEAFVPRLKQQFRELGIQSLRLINAYGPTEISVASNFGEVDFLNPASDEARVSIGHVLPGYQVCLVDEGLRPVALGCSGQIAVSGRAVSAGYLNDDSLTKEKFLPSLDLPKNSAGIDDKGYKWYLTGDMGQMDADGQLFYLGRIDGDSQIKLRGIRVELNDISNTILEVSKGVISQAVVTVRGSSQDQEQFLVAHIVFCSLPGNTEEYLDRLLMSLPLPAYMRPSQAIVIDELPMNASGKVDRKALNSLPLPSRDNATNRRSSPQHLTPTERRLMTQVWEVVLPRDSGVRITQKSDFFSAGGNSLLLLKLQSEIRKTFGVSIRLPDLFQDNTLERLASKIEAEASSGNSTAPSGDKEVRPGVNRDTIDWAAETALPVSLQSPAPSQSLPRRLSVLPTTTNTKSILLTGATGFLGTAIAKTLVSDPDVSQVHCLAVRDVESSAARRLQNTSAKIVLHAGDLSQLRLGLGEDEARLLLADAHAFVHNGADVSFLKTYDALRAPNVASTREIVRLCVEVGDAVPLHFVSTAGVVQVDPQVESLNNYDEGMKTPPPPPPIKAASVASHLPQLSSVDGYVASKWASEAMLEKAATAAPGLLPAVRIYRPSNITGPDAPDLDIAHNLLRFSRLMRAVPNMEGWTGWFDFISVEEAARAIARDVLLPSPSLSSPTMGRPKLLPDLQFVHVSGEEVIPVGDAKAYLERESGYAFRVLRMEDWVQEARGHGLSELVAAYLGMITGPGGALPRLPRLESSLFTS